jgi:glycosyltransferase involved in cell wall biosynthesis
VETRWYTCTPVDFSGGSDFFARDSGLLSRGFQSIGVESRAIMPGKSRRDDEPDLIRTDYANLSSVEWWRSLGLDGVVLYAWGRPKFLPIAAAIRKAGIFLVLNQDSAGLISPLNGWRLWASEKRARLGGRELNFAQLAKEAVRSLFFTDPLRAFHLSKGNVVSCVSPLAAEHYRRYCGIFGGERFRSKVGLVPHPVNPVFSFDPEIAKQRRIVSVGRWNDHGQKRQDLMMQVFTILAKEDDSVIIDIIGNTTPELEAWHRELPPVCRTRVHLTGRLSPGEIARRMRGAQVVYCSSAHESFHITSGEGLCCGCSVVAARLPSLSSFEWFVSDASGTLSDDDSVAGHVRALKQELAAWEAKFRHPQRIAEIWSARLHAGNVARTVLQLASEESGARSISK